MTKLRNVPNLSSSLAQLALHAGQKRAEEINVAVNIAVFDATVHLLAFTRMDGAKLTSIDIALNKGYTAAGHRADTSSYGAKVSPTGALYGIQHSNDGRFCTIAGGLPVICDDACVGGIGVSGGTPDEDKDIATAGLRAIEQALRKPRAKL